MGLRINTNVPSVNAQRNLSKVKDITSEAMTRLSSGERINKAADDAAGLAVSERLKANIAGFGQAKRNASDGISLIQTAEGGMNEVSNILIRLRELSVQAASDTVGEQERGFLNKEYQELTSEVDRIAKSTKFGSKNLLNGDGEDMDFQIGIHNNEFEDRIVYKPQDANASVSNLGIEGLSVESKGDAQVNLAAIDIAIDAVNGTRATLGATQNRLTSTIANLDVQNENMEAANSRIRDADVAAESAKLAKGNIMTAAATTVLSQANSSNNGALKLIG